MSGTQIERLLEIMARLRAPGGCPWDREQTPATLRRYVLEEAYEVAGAIDGGDWQELKDELGDLLLQVVFLAQIAGEERHFDFEGVAAAIADKLERRHPHVFGEATAGNVDEVWQRWEEIKQQERRDAGRPEADSSLGRLPAALPALPTAQRMADKAARAGFRWTDSSAALEKVGEELDELRQALGGEDSTRTEEETGDLLFAMVSACHELGVDAEAALAAACRKFAGRFAEVERSALVEGSRMEEMSSTELDRLWRLAKVRLESRRDPDQTTSANRPMRRKRS